jgi:hypothetical protein
MRLHLYFLIALLGAAPAAVAAADGTVTENVAEQGGAWTLAPGPKTEGVVFLQGGIWKPDVIRAFHETPWLDAASVRVEWRDADRAGELPPGAEAMVEVRLRTDDGPVTPKVLEIRPAWR